MSAVDPASLPHVIEPETASALGERLVEVANIVTVTLADAHGRWSELAAVFDVEGAEGAHYMLDRPRTDAADFGTALVSARNVLWDAASFSLPDLRSRREDLAARITTVNDDVDAADAAYSTASSAYWSERSADADSDATAAARADRLDADRDRTDASDAAETLRRDIEQFRQSVESAEETIASQLGNVMGGTDVHGADGLPVRVSQDFWGFVETPYPGAPSSLSTPQTLAEYLRQSLGEAVERRIGWLGTAGEDAVAAWMSEHPDFPSAVGFVDPDGAARLWNDLAAESTPASDAGGAAPGWDAGPLAQLLALAPLAIGNLNGIPASQRDLFTREGLAQLLSDDDLPDDAREKLQSLARLLERDDEVALLSVFLDTNGEPRASVAWGDVDTADQVTTMTHGIATDMGSLGGWSGSAQDLRTSLDEQTRISGVDSESAVVLFLEWDSGDTWTVQGIERPDAGAARLTQLLGGFAQVNPDAQRNLVLHSLGTTMGAQAIADNPGLVDNAWMFGSAGISPEASAALEEQIADDRIVVYATHSSSDRIAPLGRTELLSEHAVDPRNVPDVTEFSADGGYVDDFGAFGAEGLPTEGHNAQQSSEIIYWGIDGWTYTHDGSPVPIFDTESTGYLDPTAQSFMQLVVDLAEAARLEEAP